MDGTALPKNGRAFFSPFISFKSTKTTKEMKSKGNTISKLGKCCGPTSQARQHPGRAPWGGDKMEPSRALLTSPPDDSTISL